MSPQILRYSGQYAGKLRRKIKRRRKLPVFLPIVRTYVTQRPPSDEGQFRRICDAHHKFMDLTVGMRQRQNGVLLARFCNSEEELMAPLRRFYQDYDYGKGMVEYLSDPSHIAQCVVMHLDGAGKHVRIDDDTPSYVRICSSNSPYISTTRNIHALRKTLEFEQQHGDLMFDIVNQAEKMYILELPQSLVIDITCRNKQLSYYEIYDLIAEHGNSIEDLCNIMARLFTFPVADPGFVSRLWEFYRADIQRIVDYYLYLSRINESVCLGIGNMEKYILRECPNPFKGDLRSLQGRARPTLHD